MADLKEIVAFLDAELRLSEIKDYPGAMNGLQLENDGTVNRVFSAVDASLAVVEEAALQGGGLLLVHHGMFLRISHKHSPLESLSQMTIQSGDIPYSLTKTSRSSRLCTKTAAAFWSDRAVDRCCDTDNAADVSAGMYRKR